jgi:membrane protease YdiL (CAAX protease family)
MTPAPVTAIGLLLALLGPAAVAWAFRGQPLGALGSGVAGNVILLVLAFVVLGIVHFGERLDLASVGVRPPRASTFLWAGVLFAANVYLFTPFMQAVLARFGNVGFAPGLNALRAMPAWYRWGLVVVGPSIEDFLYRGYAIERLSAVMRSRPKAVLTASVIFALAHAPTWGMGVGLALVVPAILQGALYAWRRDLAVNALAHVATDALGFFLWAP